MTKSTENRGDEFLRALGLITVNFSALERMINTFVAELMIRNRASTDLAEKNFQLHLSLLITAELPFYKLLTLLESLYKHLESDSSLVAQLVLILNRAGQAANQRDVIVHSSWLNTGLDQDLIRIKMTAKKEKNKPTNLKFQSQRTSLADVKNVADSLWDVYRDLSIFMVNQGYTYIPRPG